ncbi:MAG: hypothetical protein WC777_00045 [Candidatus Gracilibacteria bacterium]|jgi:hypothetical protein
MKNERETLKMAIIIGVLYFVITVILTLIQWQIVGSGRGALLLFTMLNAHYFGFLYLLKIGDLPVAQIILFMVLLPLFNIVMAYLVIKTILYIKSKVHISINFKK